MKLVQTTMAALVASVAFAGVSFAADQIHVAGSSTVLPYAKIVAEQFAETYPDFKAPVVESGGSGAGPGFDGTSVVQTNMTNSRLTDPEILEWRFPVRLESYEIRQGSGGVGRWQGGNGGVRRVRFLEAMTAAILSNNRVVPPFGMDGGAPGALGRNYVERIDGGVDELPHIGKAAMRPGDVFVVETPGGGGYGMPE